MLRQIGRTPEAAAEYARLVERFPEDAMPYTEWAEIACLDGAAPLPEPQAVIARLRTTRFSYSPMGSIDAILQEFERDGDCGTMTGSYLAEMIDALLANPAMVPERSLLLVLRGRLHVVRGEYQEALDAYAECLTLKPRLDIAVQRIRIAVRLGRWDEARGYVDQARAVAGRSPLQALAAQRVLDDWQTVIERRLDRATG
jgi:tetratricopeptide (TPR) repeat protein